MKHFKLAMICLGFALAAMVTTEADAGRIKKPSKDSRTEKTEEQMKPARFDNYPTMQFKGGTLTREAHSGWMIGDTVLYLAKDCVITMEGAEEGSLQEGLEAIVMGVPMNGAISAWSIHISQPSYKKLGMSQAEEMKRPGPNPNVGEILEPKE